MVLIREGRIIDVVLEMDRVDKHIVQMFDQVVPHRLLADPRYGTIQQPQTQ